jgi:hypothetical protein
MAKKTTTRLKKGWGMDHGSKPGHPKEELSGPGRGAGEDFEARSFKGDRGNVKLPTGLKGQRTAPKKTTKPSEQLEVRSHSDYGTGGRLVNHVEEGGEHDPLPVSYHKNSGTSSAGCGFRGRRM